MTPGVGVYRDGRQVARVFVEPDPPLEWPPHARAVCPRGCGQAWWCETGDPGAKAHAADLVRVHLLYCRGRAVGSTK